VAQTSHAYPDMPALASRMKALGVPRHLGPAHSDHGSPSRDLAAAPRRRPAQGRPDRDGPQHSGSSGLHAGSVATIRGWGYELIKHDFSTFDLTGRWGFEMGPDLTDSGWHFHHRAKTTAEFVMDLYRAIRGGAGDAILLGCNTIGHLAAGLVEAQRIGDDTSGREWSRTQDGRQHPRLPHGAAQ
jgi:alpha-galactosidase